MGFISAIAAGGTSITEGILGHEAQKKEGKLRLQALQLRMQEIKDSATQTSIQQMSQLNKTLASTTAIEAAQGSQGVGPDMMKISDFNNFAEDQNADKLSTIFQEQPVQQDITNTIKQSQSLLPIAEGFLGAGAVAADAAARFKSSTASIDHSNLPANSTDSTYATEGSDPDAPTTTTPNASEGPDNGSSSEGPDTSSSVEV